MSDINDTVQGGIKLGILRFIIVEDVYENLVVVSEFKFFIIQFVCCMLVKHC